MLKLPDVLEQNYGLHRDKMKSYIVEKRIRIGVAKFKVTNQVMREDLLRLSFPSWQGEREHRIGNTLYIIRLISPEI